MIISEPITLTKADVTIQITPLNYDELKELHGSNRRQKLNPFIDYPGQIPQRRIVVFKTEFLAKESTIQVNIKDTSLKIGEKQGRGITPEYMHQLWKVYIANSPYVNIIPNKAKKYMLPRDFVFSPESPQTGYLVFAEPYPKEGGKSILTIPVSTPEGDQGVFEFELYFNQDGISSDSPSTGDTGKFLE